MKRCKMIPPAPPPRKKNPPPPAALAELEKNFDAEPLDFRVRLFLDGVLLEFNFETQFVLSTAKGARKLATELVRVADALEAKQNDGHRTTQSGI
jgi:hypothetical protein